MPPLPRGTCSHCGHDVAVRNRGFAREHYVRRSSGPPAFSAPAGELVTCHPGAHGAFKCAGAGKLVQGWLS